MNKVWAFIPVAFAIFALMVSPVVMSAYADPKDGTPQACYNEKAKHVGNKHCDGTSSSTQFTVCDMDKDGSIDAKDLVDYSTSLTNPISISLATSLIITYDFNSSGGLDSKRELRSFNDDPMWITCS